MKYKSFLVLLDMAVVHDAVGTLTYDFASVQPNAIDHLEPLALGCFLH